jgi:hypothetical protein
MRRVIAPSWHPSAVLLTVQLLGVLLYPFMDGPAGRAALSLFGSSSWSSPSGRCRRRRR